MAKKHLITSFVLCVAVIAAAVALGGCGGGGDDSGSTVAGGDENGGATTQDNSGSSSGQSGSSSDGSSGKSGAPSGGSGDSSGGGSSSGQSGGSGSSSGGSESAGKGGGSGKSGGSSGTSGSPSGKGATPSGGLSKTEFVKRANAICEKGKKQSLGKMQAYVKREAGGSKQASPALLVKAIKAVFIPGLETQIEEIRALGAPPGDEETVEAFLASLEEGVDAVNEASGGSAGAAFGQSFKRSGKLAREYGLNACAYG